MQGRRFVLWIRIEIGIRAVRRGIELQSVWFGLFLRAYATRNGVSKFRYIFRG